MPTIRELREDKHLSQTELAVAAGVSTGAIVRMEKGEPIQKSTLTLVCQALEVSPNSVEGVNVRRVSRKSA